MSGEQPVPAADAAVSPARRMPGLLALVAVWGPGLLVMLADTDAGNIVTAAQAGTRWGYRLMLLPLLLIPMLYMVQELTVRVGLFTQRGFGAIVREKFGRAWAWIAAAALGAAVLGSLVTEFDGIAGIGELYGVPRWVALVLSAACLLAVVLSGEYRSVERVAIAIGLFELSFFAVAVAAHPSLSAMAAAAGQQPLHDSGYLYLGAALIGATFNPWMIFYQPSALAEKQLGPDHHTAARWDTAGGAVLTQLVTAAVLVAAAATLGGGSGSDRGGLDSVGQISGALTPFLGQTVGRLVFGLGVVGAAMVAAIVCSLAFAWGLADVAGFSRTSESPSGHALFRLGYVGCVLAGALVVFFVRDLVWLSIAAQAVNALLMPVLVALLVAAAATALPPAVRLRGWYFWLVAAVCTVVAASGVAGVWAGLS